MKEIGGTVGMQNTDNVNNPKHYSGTCSLECIDIMKMILGEEAVKHFCLEMPLNIYGDIKTKMAKKI